jgi:N-acetylglucosaminyl-diphospho-decaprenol L-rhamnosyltransferase
MNLLVTITFNALKHDILDPFFASIRAQADQDFMLLVVDNASTDGTRDYLRALDLPNLRLILNKENVGFGRACNQGIALARELGAAQVTFINNDTEFGPELIGGMVASLRKTGAAALAPLITPYDRPDHIWFITGHFRWSRGIIPVHDHIWRPRSAAPAARFQRTEFVTGCCVVFRMDVFDAVAGFDDRFFVYWEDADLSMELKTRGLTVVVDTALVCRHKIGASTGGTYSAFTVYNANKGYMLFVRKHHGLAGLAWALPVVTTKLIGNLLRRRIRPREIAPWLRGLRDGLAA